MPRVGAAVLRARYISGPMALQSLGDIAFASAGGIYIAPVDVPWPIIIDRIIYQVGTTSAGNVRAGIYREGATADSPNGAALVVESASVAQSAASYIQVVTVVATVLTPGQYFVGIQGDDATATFFRFREAGASIGYWYQRSGGYGAFTNPCPTAAGNVDIPYIMLRVKENLPAGYRL